MNKNTGLVIGVIAILAVVGLVYASNTSSDKMAAEKNTLQEAVVTEEKSTSPEGGTMKKDEGVIIIKGSYVAYSPEKIAMAEKGKVVIFFHAAWCPSCRGLNSDLEKNVTSIPDGLTILKADYDKETELKKKYGVTYQHTLVQVDKDGSLIKKWSGGGSLSSVMSQIQ